MSVYTYIHFCLSIDKLEKIDDTPFSALNEDIADIMKMLTDFDTRKWRTLATHLRLGVTSMDTIEADNNNNVGMRLQCALTDWLKLNYNYGKHGRPSWKKLAEAIMPLDGNIFEKIISKYPGNNKL